MKLNPSGPNYATLKSIEDTMADYDVTDDGAIVKKTDYSLEYITY